jgi:hypothetical protein
MAKLKTEIECLERYAELMGGVEEIFVFLSLEKLVTREEMLRVKGNDAALCKALSTILRDLRLKDKVQMLEYEWQILPVERIKITVVTDTAKKEFAYNH